MLINPLELTFSRLMLVMPAPFPVNVPEMFTPLAPLVMTPGGRPVNGMAPLIWLPETVPLTLLAGVAKMAEGGGGNGRRGARVVNPPPFFCTVISSQRGSPLNTFAKFKGNVNRPLLTETLAIPRLPRSAPLVAASYR